LPAHKPEKRRVDFQAFTTLTVQGITARNFSDATMKNWIKIRITIGAQMAKCAFAGLVGTNLLSLACGT
jgi:hypothetical protein